MTSWPRSELKKTRKRAGQQARRTAAPEERRLQLIEATIRCVANRGLAETTISTVAREAGLSQGIINLHFKSKDGLLTATLRYIADEYRAACMQATAVAEVLAGQGAAGFRRPVLQPQHLQSRKARVVVRVLGRAEIPPDLSTHLRGARQGE